jgi:Uri superfamily endonuclease
MGLSTTSAKGAYALHLNMASPKTLQVGKLGMFRFPAGDYIYLGSALGPGGLKARLNHHVGGEGQPHWHIDYLRENAVLVGFCYLETELRQECLWSQTMALLPEASITAPRFGASDCESGGKKCPAHLISFGSAISLKDLQSILAAASRLPPSRLRYSSFIYDSKAESFHIE